MEPESPSAAASRIAKIRASIADAILWLRGFACRAVYSLFKRASLTNLTAFATLILALATAYLAWVADRQVGIMEADKRPWIKVTVTFAKPPRLTDWGGQKGIDVSLHFDLKNYGDSPAVNLRIESPIIVHPGNPRRSELNVPQKDACDRARAAADENPIGSVAVFPGESISVEQDSGRSGIYKTNEPVLFSILGCADYTYAGNRHGQTGFRMMLGHVTEGQIFGIPFVEGSLQPYKEPISPDLLAHGYPAVPPKITVLQPSDFILRADDGGNYTR
jgi:hypothetical protein